MPGIIAALRDHANPFSILTKGTLILRDLDLLQQAAEVTDVGISVSVGFTDQRAVAHRRAGHPRPGAPPGRRAHAHRARHPLRGADGAGDPVPRATHRPSCAPRSARSPRPAPTSVTPLVLHLRPGAREWFMAWLGQHHPHLVRRYERLYADGAYAPKWYQRRITRQVHELAAEYGIGPSRPGRARRIPPADAGRRRPNPVRPAHPAARAPTPRRSRPS